MNENLKEMKKKTKFNSPLSVHSFVVLFVEKKEKEISFLFVKRH